MAFARDVYTATGGQTDFTITYSYEDNDHIEVYQNGSLLTEDSAYTFPNATTVRLNSGATAGDVIVLQRNTSQSTKLVDFTAGTLTEADLDNAIDQVFYMAQEAIDQVAISLKKDTDEVWDADSTRIKNVASPSVSTDAANKAYVDAQTAAAGSVPTPGNPGEDDYLLTASGGTFSWQPRATINIADISDAGTVGKAILADTTAAAVRTEIDALEDVLATQGDLVIEGGSGPEIIAAGSEGQFLVQGSSQADWRDPWVYGTATAIGSVTSFDITIPTWATTVEVFLGITGVCSFDDASNVAVQLGDSGGVETADYAYAASADDGTTSASSSDTQAELLLGGAAGRTFNGMFRVVLVDSATWSYHIEAHGHRFVSNANITGFAWKSLTTAMTTIRVKSSAGGSFDSGTYNYRYQ